MSYMQYQPMKETRDGGTISVMEALYISSLQNTHAVFDGTIIQKFEVAVVEER